MIVCNLQQNSPDWLVWRRGGIGGSDAPVIMGVSPYATREQLLHEKVTGERRQSEYRMRRGQNLEAVARGMYEIEMARPFPAACVIHSDCNWLVASLDGLADWALEIKCWAWQKHSTVLAGLVPTEAWPQLQHNLLVTGLDRIDLVSYSQHSRYSERDQFVILPVYPDAEYQARLLEAEERFWEDVLDGRAKLEAQKAQAARQQRPSWMDKAEAPF
jgi:putative phage-type endonuclease